MKAPDEESTEAKVADQATTCTGNVGGPPLIPPSAEEPLRYRDCSKKKNSRKRKRVLCMT